MAVDVAGEWIPLYFTAPNVNKNNNDIDIGTFSNKHIILRSHAVYVDVGGSGGTISVCGPPLLQNTVQLRWLQTASSFSKDQTVPENWRDLWTLDDVTVVLHVNETYNTILIDDNFDNQTDLK